jgi:hypothetical protein
MHACSYLGSLHSDPPRSFTVGLETHVKDVKAMYSSHKVVAIVGHGKCTYLILAYVHVRHIIFSRFCVSYGAITASAEFQYYAVLLYCTDCHIVQVANRVSCFVLHRWNG